MHGTGLMTAVHVMAAPDAAADLAVRQPGGKGGNTCIKPQQLLGGSQGTVGRSVGLEAQLAADQEAAAM
jgi:hypothetical protein